MKQEATLKMARKVRTGDTFSLVGFVYGHPRLPDGEYVQTSEIVAELPDGRIETRNTVYTLAEDYVAQ